VRAGDAVRIIDRPAHGVTVGQVFLAMMTRPDLLADILVADALADEVKRLAARRLAG
jgi:MOSC domain-containing protein YiiM